MTRRINVRVPFLRDGWRPSRGRDNTRPNRSTYLAVVAAIVSVALAGFAWYERDQADRRSDTVTACLAAATPASQAIFSYDYRTFDAGVATARSFITGAFVNDYAATAASLQAQVSAVGVVDASPTGVDVMVYLNQYRRNANITGEKVDQNRVVLTMVRAGDSCRVSAASAI
jgi:Mce-associated membrane protein